MEQLTQNLKSGEMKLLEVPLPILNAGHVLVRNHYSLISAGTEGKTVKDARLGYIGKAMARKDEVKKMIRTAKTIGLNETYKLMMNKLDAPAALGYSCAGEVIAVASDVKEFKIGDRVACAGSGAVHAEVVSVPVNLCVKANSIDSKESAYTTLGAIAMQGVRQADLRLGESCVVIGLGLIGQLTAQLLNAAGVRTIGIDIDKSMVSLAERSGVRAFDRNTDGLSELIIEAANGYGADAVIITASANTTDPVDLAGEICRQKGKVIIVGAVPTGFKRSNYYKKELDLRMSCSYGPGRYDDTYEEQGIDYPYAYVRWTEKRNMQAFVELVAQRKLDLEKITSHIFDFKDALKAYQLIVDKQEPFTGILLKYDTAKEIAARVALKSKTAAAGEPAIGFIGAGSYASNVLLPAMKGHCNFIGITNNRSNTSRNIGDKYGFAYCTNEAGEIFNDKNINTVFIATRHDTHAAYVCEALLNHKNVFVEKPLCLDEQELEEVSNAYAKSNSLLMVGFNRRFSPLVQKAVSHFKDLQQPVAIQYRVNAGIVPAGHWIHDPVVGGGRIIGEVCHFIDLVTHLAQSKITSLSAYAMHKSHDNADTLTINAGFANGSVASIAYFSNGNKELNKEYIEIFGSGQVAVIDDFKELSLYGKSVKNTKLSAQDKGHKQEMKMFLDSVRKGGSPLIPFEDVCHSMLCTFKVAESVKMNGAQIRIQ